MKSIENRINKLEETTGLKKKGPDKIIFQVMGEKGTIIKTFEVPIQYRSNIEGKTGEY